MPLEPVVQAQAGAPQDLRIEVAAVVDDDAHRGAGRQPLSRVRCVLRPGAPVCIVVNDRRDLYPEILSRAGLRLEDRLERHVNRRTGRRAGEYFESILVCR